MINRINTLMLLAVLTGCASIPPQTGQLSAQVGKQIAEAKKSHMALIDEWAVQRRERAETFLHYVWTPRFIANFLKKPKVKAAFDDKVCVGGGEMDRALVIQNVVEAISKQVEKRRRKMFGAIAKAKRKLKSSVRDHYAQTEAMNTAITANLQSASKGLELEKQVRKAIARPLEDIAPFKKASNLLDKLLEEEE